ncbi:MAG: hypothetical protein ACRC6G_00825 [Deefgea sp.]
MNLSTKIVVAILNGFGGRGEIVGKTYPLRNQVPAFGVEIESHGQIHSPASGFYCLLSSLTQAKSTLYQLSFVIQKFTNH